MTLTESAAITVSGAQVVAGHSRRTWRPGPIYLTVLAIALTTYAYLTALPGFSIYLIPLIYVGGALGIIWFVSLVRAAYFGGLSLLSRSSRWVAIAVVVAIVGLAGWYGLFLRLGFEVSRSALETAATKPGSTGFAGIYLINAVRETTHSTTIRVGFPAGLFDDVGFHRSTLGDDGGDCDEGGQVHRLDNHWYAVSCSW